MMSSTTTLSMLIKSSGEGERQIDSSLQPIKNDVKKLKKIQWALLSAFSFDHGICSILEGFVISTKAIPQFQDQDRDNTGLYPEVMRQGATNRRGVHSGNNEGRRSSLYVTVHSRFAVSIATIGILTGNICVRQNSCGALASALTNAMHYRIEILGD